MSTFVIRNIDPVLWKKVQDRARIDGVTPKTFILTLLANTIAADTTADARQVQGVLDSQATDRQLHPPARKD